MKSKFYQSRLSQPSVFTLKYSPQHNQGFTLIELMVALVIFAMLAVVGWQVFDGLNRAKVATKKHAQALSDLQYAYLQLQNDFTQVVAWGKVNASSANNVNTTANNSKTNLAQQTKPEQTGFYVSPQGVSFVRFADPDPRYQNTPTLIRVSYIVADGKLIRHQLYDLNASSLKGVSGLSSNGFGDDVTEVNSSGLNTMLLSGIENSRWQQLDGDKKGAVQFSGQFAGQLTTQNTSGSNISTNSRQDNNPLPKGIAVEFEIDGQPILWQFALPTSVDVTLSSNASVKKDAQGNPQNRLQNGSNNNGNTNSDNGSSSNGSNGTKGNNGTQPNSSSQQSEQEEESEAGDV